MLIPIVSSLFPPFSFLLLPVLFASFRLRQLNLSDLPSNVGNSAVLYLDTIHADDAFARTLDDLFHVQRSDDPRSLESSRGGSSGRRRERQGVEGEKREEGRVWLQPVREYGVQGSFGYKMLHTLRLFLPLSSSFVDPDVFLLLIINNLWLLTMLIPQDISPPSNQMSVNS